MKYSKPEVNTLGQAKSVIEQFHTKPGGASEVPNGPKILNPAYDLDE
jgi:hypothetical protein